MGRGKNMDSHGRDSIYGLFKFYRVDKTVAGGFLNLCCEALVRFSYLRPQPAVGPCADSANDFIFILPTATTCHIGRGLLRALL